MRKKDSHTYSWSYIFLGCPKPASELKCVRRWISCTSLFLLLASPSFSPDVRWVHIKQKNVWWIDMLTDIDPYMKKWESHATWHLSITKRKRQVEDLSTTHPEDERWSGENSWTVSREKSWIIKRNMHTHWFHDCCATHEVKEKKKWKYALGSTESSQTCVLNSEYRNCNYRPWYLPKG